jgi:hypothetical protein
MLQAQLQVEAIESKVASTRRAPGDQCLIGLNAMDMFVGHGMPGGISGSMAHVWHGMPPSLPTLGYEGTDEETSWILASKLGHASELVADFHSAYPAKPSPLSKS